MLLQIITAISDFLWGTPMTVALVGTGLYLGIRFGFRYNFRKVRFNFRNTFGKMFRKGEGAGTVSGFAAACTAMANTIGVGNIGGVATAIVSGGPGAVFWMWVSGLLGMSTKACEIILGQRYRVKYSQSMDEYMCDRSFVMRNALGWKKGAVVLAVACFVLGPWTCCVQTESVTGALEEGFGIDPTISVIVLGLTCFLTIAGGLKRISAIMERVVPFMALLYILGGLGILLMNLPQVPSAVALIFKSAFTPMAGVGGFAGATVRDAIRYGIARGLYSNDAGTGYGIIAHASAKTDHPVRQASWGWGEVFLDTIVVCSITAISILVSGALETGKTSMGLTIAAFEMSFGRPGEIFIAFLCVLFGITTTAGWFMFYTTILHHVLKNNVQLANKIEKVLKICYPIPNIVIVAMIVMTGSGPDMFWTIVDISLVVPVFFNVIALLALSGKYKALLKDYRARYLNEGEVDPDFKVFYDAP